MTARYATYFDRHFLTRGLALIESLRQHAGDVTINVLSLDGETHDCMCRLALRNVRLLALEDLESADPELAAARKSRTLLEYYFTLTPAYLSYLLQSDPAIETLTYVDSDHFFFADPAPIYAELGDGHIGIIEHRYPPRYADNYVYGRFNVGILVFKRSPEARACLDRWRQQCLDWCYERVEGGRYADQAYLNEWPERYCGVRVLEHPGVGIALWNCQDLTWNNTHDRVVADGSPLITYHFSRFRIITPWLFDIGARWFGFKPNRVLRYGVYLPYARAVQRASKLLRAAGAKVESDTIRDANSRFKLLVVTRSIEKLQVLATAVFRRTLLLVAGPIGL
jgi:hypothetical protein